MDRSRSSFARALPGLLVAALVTGSPVVVRPAFAVGATNHSELALRGGLWFDAPEHPEYAEWVRQYSGALRAGAAYPDWGYAFDGFGDLAEDSHWPPYHEEASRYIRETYPQPWNADTKRLVVFLLGIRSHWIADLDWHGLGGVREGLIDVMSAQETNGDWSQAHTNADTGGEFVGTAQLDLSWAQLSEPWYVPTQDLVAIAARLGYPQTQASDVNLGMLTLRAEQTGIRSFGQNKTGYANWAPVSPMLMTELRDYFVGGLNDMSAQSMWSWDEVVGWLEDGVPAARRPQAAPLSARRALDALHREHGTHGTHGTLTPAELKRLGLSIEETGRGATIRVDATSTLGSVPASPSSGDRRVDGRAAAPFGTRSLTLESAAPYGLAGTSLAVGDLDGDGVDDLAVGLPGYSVIGGNQLGRVEIVSGGAPLEGHASVDLAEQSTRTLTGGIEYGRFGAALAVCDLNADGIDDLAVSSPTVGARDYGYQGRVEVFYGAPGVGIAATPGLTITTTRVYENLGHALAGGDLDGDGHADLLVASPFAREGGSQRGVVAAFLASGAVRRGGEIDVDSADWTLSGTQSWAWFGDSLAVTRGAASEPLVLVGAPKWKEAGAQGVGRLYAYDASALGARGVAAVPVFTITGDAELENLATSFAVGTPGAAGPMLAIGSPTRDVGDLDQAGEVLVVPLAGLSGDLTRGDLPASAILAGDTAYTRFGHRLAFGDVDGDGDDELWVGEPWRDATAPAFLVGAAYGFLGGPSFPSGTVAPARAAADVVLDETERAAFLGISFAFPDLDHDGAAELALSARVSSARAPEGGVVRVVGFEPANRIFDDGFESGGFGAWSSSVPRR